MKRIIISGLFLCILASAAFYIAHKLIFKKEGVYIIEGDVNRKLIKNNLQISGTDQTAIQGITMQAVIDEKRVFIGRYKDDSIRIALEGTGVGYSGEIQVMTAFDLKTDTIKKISISQHNETPGLVNFETDDNCKKSFQELHISENLIQPDIDGGNIDVISGATLSTRGVCQGVNDAINIYKQIKPVIIDKIESGIH